MIIVVITIVIIMIITIIIIIIMMIMMIMMMMMMMMIISNSNWTSCRTVQGVIERVISKLDECEVRGRFEITSAITP